MHIFPDAGKTGACYYAHRKPGIDGRTDAELPIHLKAHVKSLKWFMSMKQIILTMIRFNVITK